MRTFAEWQPRYAEHGIATFPVRGKVPLIRNYDKLRPPGSAKLVARFGDASAFGFALEPAGIVVVDVDTPDERVLDDALDRHGDTPFIVRSGSGHFQAWYRRTNEGRRIPRDRTVPIDILGKGFVVAPPSVSDKGPYEIIQGSLADLGVLPRMKNPPVPGAGRRAKDGEPEAVGIGKRNDTLWRHCMAEAHYCDDLNALFDVARTANADCMPPLSDDEVVKLARSAWGYTDRGENRFGRAPHVIASHSEIDGLLQEDPDAFTLLLILRRHHAPDAEFVVANAMADAMPGGGWTRKRLASARGRLEDAGQIVETRAASRWTGPSLYRFLPNR